MTRTVHHSHGTSPGDFKTTDSIEVNVNGGGADASCDLQPLLFCLLDCLQDTDADNRAEADVMKAIHAAIRDLCNQRQDALDVLDGCFSYVDRSQCRVTGPAHKSSVFHVVAEVVLPALESIPDEITTERIVDLVGIIINEISNNSEESLLRSCASVLSRLARIDLDCVLVEIFSRADTVSSAKANVYVETLIEICDNCDTKEEAFKHLHATEIIRITDELDSSTRQVPILIACVCKRVVTPSDADFAKKVSDCQWLHEDPVAFKVVKAAFDRLMGRITQDVESDALNNALKVDTREASAKLEAASRLLLLLLDRSPTAVVGSIAVLQKACLAWLGSLLKITPPRGILTSLQIAPVLSGIRVLAASGKALADRESLLELQELLVALVQNNRPLAVLSDGFTPPGVDSPAVVREVLTTWVALGGEQCMAYLLDKRGLAEPSQPHSTVDRCVALLCMRACAESGLSTTLLSPTLDLLCRETTPPVSNYCTTMPVEAFCLIEVLSVMGVKMAPLPGLYDYLLSLLCLTDADCEREVALTAGQRFMKRFSSTGSTAAHDWPRRDRDGMVVNWRTVRKRALEVLLQQAARDDSDDQQGLHAAAVLYDRLMACLLSGSCDREHQLDKVCLLMVRLVTSTLHRELVTPLGVDKGCHLLTWLLASLADEGLCELDDPNKRVVQDIPARRNIVGALRVLAASIHSELQTMWESPFSRLSELEDGSRSSGDELQLFLSRIAAGSEIGDEAVYAEAICVYVTNSLLPHLASLATVPPLVELDESTPRSTAHHDVSARGNAAVHPTEAEEECGFISSCPSAVNKAAALDATTGTAFVLLGVAASRVPSIVKMAEYVDKWLLLSAPSSDTSQGARAASAVLLARPQGRRGLAKALGRLAGVHFDHVTDLMRRAAASHVATRRPSAFSIFDNTELLQQGEWIRATVNASLGYCAMLAPSPRVLQRRLRAFFLEPLLTALKEERQAAPLAAAIRGIKLTADGLMRTDVEGGGDPQLEIDPSLALLRDELVVALLPFLLQPVVSNSAVSSAAWKLEASSSSTPPQPTSAHSMGILLCDVLQCIGSLIALPLDLQPRIFAQILETALQVLVMSLPESAVPPVSATVALATGNLEEIGQLFADEWVSANPDSEPEVFIDEEGDVWVDGLPQARVVECSEVVVAALLSHARTWLGVSRLMQAVHSAGGSGPVEALRWACARLSLVLCENAPVLLPDSRRELGEWCECVALILPHVGDSSLAVRRASREAMRLLLERNERSHDRVEEMMPSEPTRTEPAPHDRRRPCMSHQLLAIGLADVLPGDAVPALLQHLMRGVHNSDLRAVVSTIDALHLILVHRASSFDKETAAKMISTVFDNADRLPSGSVLQQKVLACTQVLASTQFDSAMSELLEVGEGEFSQSQLHAIRVMVKEKPLLLRMLNSLTDILNNSFPSSDGQPNRMVTAATEALFVIFAVEDSVVTAALKRHVPEILVTLLLRVASAPTIYLRKRAIEATTKMLEAVGKHSMALALQQQVASAVTARMNTPSQGNEFDTEDVHADGEINDIIDSMIFLFCRSTSDEDSRATRQKLVEFALPFVLYWPSVLEASSGAEDEHAAIEHVLGPVDRLTPGDREDCWELAHTELGGSSTPRRRRSSQACVPHELVSDCTECFLSVVEDSEQPGVRKYATRGLANVLLLAADKDSGLSELMDEKAIDILDRLTLSLGDADTDLVQEAVNASHRAAVLRPIGCDPEVWESHVLTELGPALCPLTDSPSPVLRKSVFYLLSKLSQICTAHPPTSACTDSFFRVEARIAVTCAIRLWDNSVAVSDSAKSCLAMLLRNTEAHDSLLSEAAKSAAALSDLVGVLVKARSGRLLTHGCDLEYHIGVCCDFINGVTDGGIEIAAATIAVSLLANLGLARISRDTSIDLRKRLMRITVALSPWSHHKPHMAGLIGLLAAIGTSSSGVRRPDMAYVALLAFLCGMAAMVILRWQLRGPPQLIREIWSSDPENANTSNGSLGLGTPPPTAVNGSLRVPGRLEDIMCASSRPSNWENYTVFYDLPKPYQRTSELEMLWLYQVAHTTARILERFGYAYVACGGTLIGALRDRGIVAHDDDIDLCTDKRNFRRMMKDPGVLEGLNANGLQLLQFNRYKGGVGCRECRADRERCRPLDILEMVKHPQDPSRLIMHFCYNEVKKKGDGVDRADCRGRTFPVDVLDHADSMPFGSSTLRTPELTVAESHLTSTQGADCGDA
ncbi:hypothetical protein FOZ62_031480 [Perkinsus olseni]|uniref:LicD/FKTN/FKRP nucleotidyltransferase domain-containing protein n=2 Tax=Perkinsus olseni TaxID=32597 RepID=A0A7J6T8G9_PEROL|nr:hypothetical protein FOZ62_031480 [Perkinsus olseni]